MENKDLDLINYIKQVYTGFLKDTNDEFCQITFNREHAAEAIDEINYIENALLELNLKEVKSTEEMECNNAIKNHMLKYQEQEKENEILKQIIKSFFDKGSPLHQYIDKKFGLTIEVDSDCSIMHLGSFKGVDLDKKLKEILE